MPTCADRPPATRKVPGTAPTVVDRAAPPTPAYVDVTPTQRYRSGGPGPQGAPPLR